MIVHNNFKSEHLILIQKVCTKTGSLIPLFYLILLISKVSPIALENTQTHTLKYGGETGVINYHWGIHLSWTFIVSCREGGMTEILSGDFQLYATWAD